MTLMRSRWKGVISRDKKELSSLKKKKKIARSPEWLERVEPGRGSREVRLQRGAGVGLPQDLQAHRGAFRQSH